jgi:hypothetical protein
MSSSPSADLMRFAITTFSCGCSARLDLAFSEAFGCGRSKKGIDVIGNEEQSAFNQDNLDDTYITVRLTLSLLIQRSSLPNSQQIAAEPLTKAYLIASRRG